MPVDQHEASCKYPIINAVQQSLYLWKAVYLLGGDDVGKFVRRKKFARRLTHAHVFPAQDCKKIGGLGSTTRAFECGPDVQGRRL